jgi:hypothetical protein
MMLVQFKNYDVGKINDEKTTIWISPNFVTRHIPKDEKRSRYLQCNDVLFQILCNKKLHGNDVTRGHNRKYVLRMRNRYILYYYSNSTKYSTVVKVPWLPEVTKGVPLGVRMRNRKLYNIHPSWTFWPDMGARMRNRNLRNIRSNVEILKSEYHP